MKVLVLHASALHLGFLGCYGNTWVETPHLDRLAAESVVFDQHYANRVGERTDWPDLFPGSGVLTAAVDAATLVPEEDATPLETTLDATVAALERLSDEERCLCWVNLPSLHPPWQVPEGFTARYLADQPVEEDDEETDSGEDSLEPLLAPEVGALDADDLILWERLRCTYAGAVSYLDAGLGLLFEEMRSRGWFADFHVIFTADRGLALGEHGIVGDCRPWLHDEVVHLPLVVRQPGAADAGLRVAALTQPSDLAATLFELYQIPLRVAGAFCPGHTEGRSWLPLVRGEVEAIREHALSRWSVGDEEEWSLRTPEWALVLPPKAAAAAPPRPIQLYAKPEDRWELNNLVQHHLDLADELEKKLRGFFA